MKPTPTTHDDRRRHARLDPIATAAVYDGARLLGTFLVNDLSAGGAALEGENNLDVGADVTLRLTLPGRPTLSFEAKVLRHQVSSLRRQRCAVAFRDVPPDQISALRDGIAEALQRDRERRLNASVLVLDPSPDVREALQRDLLALGNIAVCVATPLEAVAWLARQDSRILVVMVDLAAGPAQGLDLLEYLASELPQIRRVVMGDGAHPFRLDLAVRIGRAHASVPKPWDPARLPEALGRAL
jgi:CheY-like chemotaxis protein